MFGVLSLPSAENQKEIGHEEGVWPCISQSLNFMYLIYHTKQSIRDRWKMLLNFYITFNYCASVADEQGVEHSTTTDCSDDTEKFF